VSELLDRLLGIARAQLPKKPLEPDVPEVPGPMASSEQGSVGGGPSFSATHLNYFANLECTPTEDRQRVTAAWKALMKRYHPDLHGKDQEKRAIAEQLTQQLNLAYREICIELDRRNHGK
jgi:DnaJ-domain-containing protein 1